MHLIILLCYYINYAQLTRLEILIYWDIRIPIIKSFLCLYQIQLVDRPKIALDNIYHYIPFKEYRLLYHLPFSGTAWYGKFMATAKLKKSTWTRTAPFPVTSAALELRKRWRVRVPISMSIVELGLVIWCALSSLCSWRKTAQPHVVRNITKGFTVETFYYIILAVCLEHALKNYKTCKKRFMLNRKL